MGNSHSSGVLSLLSCGGLGDCVIRQDELLYDEADRGGLVKTSPSKSSLRKVSSSKGFNTGANNNKDVVHCNNTNATTTAATNATTTASNGKPNATTTASSPPPTKAGPWVDEDRSQSDPLPLVNEHDTRPSTRDLIQQHQSKIDKVKVRLASSSPYYCPVRYDDLWILRYILSQKTVPKATQAALSFLEYRHELQLDALDIRHAPPSLHCEMDEGVRQYYTCLDDDAMIFALPDDQRGIVILARLAGFQQSDLMKTVSLEDWPFWYFMEWSFQVLDSITRRTGRLTKGIRIVDLEGYSLSQNDKAHLDRASDNAKCVQDQYPQMLASVFVVNAPSFFTFAFKLVKPLMPKRFVEKFDILSKKQTKRFLQHVALKDLPTKFGGALDEWPYPLANLPKPTGAETGASTKAVSTKTSSSSTNMKSSTKSSTTSTRRASSGTLIEV